MAYQLPDNDFISHPNEPIGSGERHVQVPNKSISENTDWGNRVSSVERDSGYSLNSFLMTLVGLVLIAFIKSTWSIGFGTLLAFAGLLSPFYKDQLWEFIHRFRLVVEHRWGDPVQVQPTQTLQLISEKTGQKVTPITDGPTPLERERSMHQKRQWHTHVSLDYHRCVTSPLPPDDHQYVNR
jgi:hypothetical protein